MAKKINILTDRKLKGNMKPGYHADGDRLYVRVKPSGAKSFTFRWKVDGKTRELGLGGYPSMSLSLARELAEGCRTALYRGKTPTLPRNQKKQHTFKSASEEFLKRKEAEWSNEKYRKQVRSLLERHCKSIATKPVRDIDLDEVQQVLMPIWQRIPDTARKLREKIEKILALAITMGWREGPNPAVWKGNLEMILPRTEKLIRGHHKALDYSKLPEFYRDLSDREGLAAEALKFLILTAGRTSEILRASWEEFDLEMGVWEIPANRMKARKAHRIPLSNPALAILQKLRPISKQDFIFAGQRPGRPLSNMAMSQLLKRLDYPDITVHGFRSSFRDWAAEQSSANRETIELSLAHSVGNAVEQAYRRTDVIEKRRMLMNQWADFCTFTNKVVALRA